MTEQPPKPVFSPYWLELQAALAERDRLKALNAELLAALELAASEIEELHRRAAQRDWAGYSGAHGVCVVYAGRAAIAKAKREVS